MVWIQRPSNISSAHGTYATLLLCEAEGEKEKGAEAVNSSSLEWNEHLRRVDGSVSNCAEWLNNKHGLLFVSAHITGTCGRLVDEAHDDAIFVFICTFECVMSSVMYM